MSIRSMLKIAWSPQLWTPHALAKSGSILTQVLAAGVVVVVVVVLLVHL